MSLMVRVTAILALMLAGCADDDPTQTGSTDGSSVDSPSATTTPGQPAAPLADARRCTSPDGFAISYPGTWSAVSDCGQFGPGRIDEPAPGTDERTGVIVGYVDRVAYRRVARPADDHVRRAVSVVDGRRALRIVAVSTGSGLLPEGTRSVRWIIDRATGPDGEGEGTLFLTADDTGIADFDEAVRTLDAMVRAVDVTVGDTPETAGIVARYAGGGAPFAVAATGAATRPSTCLRLIDLEGVRCVATAGAGEISAARLDGPAGAITVGIVGPDVAEVAFATDGAVTRYRPVPYPARDSRGFAVPFPPDRIERAALVDEAGSRIATLDGDAILAPAD